MTDPDGSPLSDLSEDPTGRKERDESGQYLVLARKYRPSTFAELIGQEAMVRTLTNAIRSGRLAHAFILTGVRGVGKTTTARIIARALNCIGEDAQGGPTPEPCGVCEHCRAITEDRHVDVLEMDAASRTKVEEMRELLDGVRYRPTSARYKVYIIDEVHMLSKHAFNALLKTLEEPPEHVKFIFATTETRKVPVTVLSRCQRFDLRRIDVETLIAHYTGIAEKEGAKVTAAALHLIAAAADGSVRDGLSLLDQAISLTSGDIGESAVREMLGLADRSQSFTTLEAVLKGDIVTALRVLADQYETGADPVQVLQDLLEIVHWVTRLKVAPGGAKDPSVSETERVMGTGMAEHLSMAVLARAWQMLLKGLGEVKTAPRPLQATEMILIRLAFAADLPTPAEALKALEKKDGGPASGATAPLASAGSAAEQASILSPPPPEGQPRAAFAGGGETATPEPLPEQPMETEVLLPDPTTFDGVVALTDEANDSILHGNLISNLHLVHFEPGRIEFHPGDHAPTTLAHDLSCFLNESTPRRWVVTVSSQPGAVTLQQQEESETVAAKADAALHPLIQTVMEIFPGAEIEKIHPPPPAAEPPEKV